jgi:dephospho-CoA kinase
VILGITGCVGSGKSTLASALGFPVLDVDEVGAVSATAIGLRPADALTRVLQGDRALEAQLANLVKPAIAKWLEVTARPCVIDSALLFEQGLDASCTLTVCLTCPADVRRARVLQRRTASARLFDLIESAQWDEARKAARAGLVLASSGSIDALVAQVKAAMLASAGERFVVRGDA